MDRRAAVVAPRLLSLLAALLLLPVLVLPAGMPGGSGPRTAGLLSSVPAATTPTARAAARAASTLRGSWSALRAALPQARPGALPQARPAALPQARGGSPAAARPLVPPLVPDLTWTERGSPGALPALRPQPAELAAPPLLSGAPAAARPGSTTYADRSAARGRAPPDARGT